MSHNVGWDLRQQHPAVEMAGKQSFMNTETQKQWKQSRSGFKHELALTLVDQGFSFREADQIVHAIFSAMKTALLRKESIIVEGFGRWHIEGPLTPNRGWRFGKVIQLKPYKITFEIEAAALAQAGAENWNPHPAWQAQSSRKPKLKGRKLALSLRQQAEQRYRELLRQYTRLIVKFIGDELPCRDLLQFWTLRHGGWFYGQASEVPQSEKHAVNFSEAAAVIGSTKLGDLPLPWPDGEIEAMRWYARWSTRLDVDPEIWKEAESWAAAITLRP